MYDVVVVGGGAVGLYLARKFAEKNSSVLLLEKKEKIGQKPCSGLVSSKIFEFINKGEDDFIENEFLKARIWLEGNFFDFNGKALLLNREKLDKYFFEKAKKAGVDIRLKKEVRKIEKYKINTPHYAGSSCALANVTMEGMTATEFSAALWDRYQIFTVAIEHPIVKGVRITPHLSNSIADIERLKSALKELAS